VSLRGVWNIGAAEAWAGGDAGVVLIWDGVRWSLSRTGNPGSVRGVWADGDALMAIDEFGNIFQRVRRGAGDFSLVYAPPPFTDSISCFSAPGGGGGIVRACSFDSTARRAVLRTWTDRNWASPASEARGSSSLSALWTFPTGESWVAGGSSVGMLGAPASWQLSFNALWFDIWANAPDDVWAVGNPGAVAHFDGQTWRASASADSGTALTLYAVSGSGRDDIWAGGIGGALLHWNGGSWAHASTGSERPSLRAVWASGAGDAWAVGDAGSRLHWDGAAWTEVAAGSLAATRFTAVAGNGPGDVWAVAADATLHHWDGRSWTQNAAISSPGGLNDVWISGDEVWVCGADGLVARRSGSTFERHDLPEGITCQTIWGVSASNLWAGTYQSLWHWNGQGWMQGPMGNVKKIHGSGPSEVWVAGSALGATAGTLLHFDGQTWAPVATGAPGDFVGVWVQSPTQAWAVGASGSIVRWNGQSWSAVASGTNEPLSGVFGAGGSVWAVGVQGIILQRLP
jgi:hypothetical protein